MDDTRHRQGSGPPEPLPLGESGGERVKGPKGEANPLIRDGGSAPLTGPAGPHWLEAVRAELDGRVDPPKVAVPRRTVRGEGGASDSERQALAALQFPRRSITTGNRLTGETKRATGRSPFGSLELMVDTVHVVFPITVNRPLVGGWRLRLTEAQNLDWELAEDFKFEGTWGTNILVHNVAEDGRRVSTEWTEKNHEPGARRVYRQWVKVMGSPTKHATGQNAFGTLDLEALLLYLLELLREHPYVDDVDELEFWREARLTKLDISGIARVAPEEDLRWLLDYVAKHAVVAGKHKDVNGFLRGNTTWYSHMATAGTQVDHQLKLYAKGPDITKPPKKGGVRRELYFYDLLEQDSRNWLRIERALHTKALRRWYSDSPSYWTEAQLVRAWEQGVESVTWPQFSRRDGEALLAEGNLTAGARDTFKDWLLGRNPWGRASRDYSRAQLYRHRKDILAASGGRVDIKNPRPQDDVPEVVRIVRTGPVERPDYLRGLPLVA